MQLKAVHFAGLFLLVLVIPAYQVIRNLRDHRVRRDTVVAQGWRYSVRGWKLLYQSDYRLAGTTPGGIVWELTRVLVDGRWRFTWSAVNQLLPYGTLIIAPRHATNEQFRPGALTPETNLRRVAAGSNALQAKYVVLTTHNILAERFFGNEVEFALLGWPEWPAPGALQKAVWTTKELVIHARHQNEWTTVVRIVNLGTTLTESSVRTQDID